MDLLVKVKKTLAVDSSRDDQVNGEFCIQYRYRNF